MVLCLLSVDLGLVPVGLAGSEWVCLGVSLGVLLI